MSESKSGHGPGDQAQDLNISWDAPAGENSDAPEPGLSIEGLWDAGPSLNEAEEEQGAGDLHLDQFWNRSWPSAPAGVLAPPHPKPPTTRVARDPSLAKYAVTSLFALLVLLAIDAVYIVVGLASALPETESSLREGRDALSTGDLDRADRAFGRAISESSGAVDLTRHPASVIGSFLPGIGADVKAIAALSEAARLAAEAGQLAEEGAKAAGVTGAGLASSLYEGGRVRLDAVEMLGDSLQEADQSLRAAADVLAAADDPVIGRIESRLRQAEGELGEATTQTSAAVNLFGILPDLLGAESPQEYFLAFQAPSEARATGGILGQYGVLRAEGGLLELTRVGPTSDLPDLEEPVDAPEWFTKAYGEFPQREWRQTNASPNFPVVADIWLQMYQRVRGRALDGVIAMDPVALAELVEGTGRLRPQTGPVITPQNAESVLMRDSYLQFDPDTQDQYLSQVLTQFWGMIESGRFDGRDLTDAFINSVREGHIKVYTPTRKQAVISSLGADAAYARVGPNVQAIFNNNYSANKVDYYLYRSIDSVVQLEVDGTASVTTTVTVENRAPAGPPSTLLGASQPGLNTMVLNFLLPRLAQNTIIESGAGRREPPLYRDEGYPVVWELVLLEPGETRQVTVNYDLPFSVGGQAGTDSFSFGLWPQAGVRPDTFRVSIMPPVGASLVTGEGRKLKAFVLSGQLSEPQTVSLRIARG